MQVIPGPGAQGEFIGLVSPGRCSPIALVRGASRPSVGWSLVLVLALDTSTPTVTAGVVSLRQPHELVSPDPDPDLTAGPNGSLGLAAADSPSPRPIVVLAEHTVTDPYAHAERLMPLARAALAESQHLLPDLDAIVVGLGPGPFTGLRVGIATAAALGDALDIPVHGVPSHDALARCVGPLADVLLVVTDARRREVYLSAYGRDGRRLFGPLVARPAAVPELLAGHGVARAQLAGPGAPLLDGIIDPAITRPVAVAGDPLSGGLVERAAVALLTGAVPGPLTPLYLRRPDATEPGARRSVLGR